MGIRAFVATKNDHDVQTAVTELDEAELGAGEVDIDVEWSAVNYKDAMVAQPGNAVARISPLVPGVDLAGTVRESRDPGLAVGDPVIVHGYDLGVAHHGGFAERARVPAAWVVPRPADLSARTAMTIGTAGFTAELSHDRLIAGGLTPGDGPVLVTGASGGVGSMAVATLAHHGFDVTASTGKAAEHDYLKALGANEIIGRQELAVDEKRVLGKERWAGAIDCVGGATLGHVLRTLRYGATVAASGLTGGSGLETTVYPFIIRGVVLAGVDSVATPLALRRAQWSTMSEHFSPAQLEAMVAEEVGLDQLANTLAKVFAAQMRGRALVLPDR
jgi:acrylyl-CoA reductase (NADPH)